MRTYFVTATGTEIGKTVVTARMVRELRAAGRVVEAIKPVASGVDPEQLEASDPGVLLQAMERPLSELDSICPWRFLAPLAPDQAAEAEGQAIDFESLVAFCEERRSEILLVEGVGGVRVPLARDYSVVDWILRLKAEAILVGGTYLGSISHLLSALDTLRFRGVVVRAIVLNRSREEPMPVETMLRVLKPFCGDLPIGVLPRMDAPLGDEGPNLSATLGF